MIRTPHPTGHRPQATPRSPARGRIRRFLAEGFGLAFALAAVALFFGGLA